jgi:hypothetical protein
MNVLLLRLLLRWVVVMGWGRRLSLLLLLLRLVVRMLVLWRCAVGVSGSIGLFL